MRNCYVVGIGLIGGSFAKALKILHPETEIFGIDHNPNHLAEAEQLGIIDKEATYSDLKNAEMVILSIPGDAALVELPKIMEVIADDTVVVDMNSTKHPICNTAEELPQRRNFLAAHPIAGTEFSGPQAALSDLYENKTLIVCEVEKTAPRLQEKALKFFREMGMRLRYMNPKEHDKHIAYVSHLSHISSFMLGKTVLEKEKNERDIFDMAGSGFASTVRLAKSSPDMWTPIFKQNKANVIETLEEYIDNLNHFKDLLKKDDFDGIYAQMKSTNHIKEVLNNLVKEA